MRIKNEAVIFVDMQTSKFLYWGAQIGGWMVYAVLSILATYAENPSKINSRFWAALLVMLVSGLLITHTMRLFLLRFNWLKIKFGPLVPRILGISLLSAFFFVLLIEFSSLLINRTAFWGEKSFVSNLQTLRFFIDVVGSTLLFILWNAIYFTYHFFRKSINQELYNLQLQASQHEIELKTLRAQLNPHFLFNALNSIRALIDIEPSKAKQSVTTLSSLLRNSLVLGRNEFIPLSEELQIVKSYLDLEKIRFEERLEIEWKTDEEISSFLVPPFMLQTVVENAIKHGISKSVEGGLILVETKKTVDGSILLIVQNTGNLQAEKDAGIGIENTIRRLDLLYKGKANFELKQAGEMVACTILIKN